MTDKVMYGIESCYDVYMYIDVYVRYVDKAARSPEICELT